MRVLLALALALVPSAGMTDTAAEKIAAYCDLRPQCRQAEAGDRTLAEAESNAACADLNKLGEEIVAAGYCWNRSEQEWTADKALCKD